MSEYEAEVSGSHEEIQRHRRLLEFTLKTETTLQRTGTMHIKRSFRIIHCFTLLIYSFCLSLFDKLLDTEQQMTVEVEVDALH